MVMAWHHGLPAGSVPWVAAKALVPLMLVGYGAGVAVILGPSTITSTLALVSGTVSRCLHRRIAAVGLLVMWFATASIRTALTTIHTHVISVLHSGATPLLHGLDHYTGRYLSTTHGVRSIPCDYGPVAVVMAAPAALLGNVRYANASLGAISLLVLGG